MDNEDLLVTNAFYPIAVLTDNGATQSARIEYPRINHTNSTNNSTSYKEERMGPYPTVHLAKEQKYNPQTTREFKSYLKQKNQHQHQQQDNNINSTNAHFMDSVMEQGNMPVFFDKHQETRGLKIRKITINVDSRQRDTNLYPNAYAYTVPLPFKIQNIKYVEMTSCEMPMPPSGSGFNPSSYPYMFICSKYLADVEKYGTVDSIFTKVQLIPNDTVPTMAFNTHLPHTMTTFVDTPLDQLSELEFELKYPDNTWYNGGNGGNHSFTLVFTVYIDIITNSFISSRRGIQDRTNLDTNVIM
jgi:hypothetical protein